MRSCVWSAMTTRCDGRRIGLTLCEVLDGDVVELLDLLHDQLLLVDLDDDRRVSCIPAREPELAQGGLELLGNVDGARLVVPQEDRRINRDY